MASVTFAAAATMALSPGVKAEASPGETDEAASSDITASAVSFGFSRKSAFNADGDGAAQAARVLTGLATLTPRSTNNDERHVGLGNGLGSQLTRSALGNAAYMPVDPFVRARNLNYVPNGKVMRARKVLRLKDGISDDYEQSYSSRNHVTARDGTVTRDMFKQLLLSDLSWATEPTVPEDLAAVREHRWAFRGGVEMASRGQSDCFFVRCLLDMQQNVQCEEDGNALDPKLVQACKLFVNGQCGAGRNSEMYQLLTHFVSNAVIFDEWARYLAKAFDNERANQEAFLVPHLEQVWFRFQRMVPVLEEIFDVLNERFIWRHRLPKVGDVVRESMKRRCFCSKAVNTNEMFTQEKCNNETVKKIKRGFRLGY